MARICDYMHRGTVTCRLEDTGRDVAGLMEDYQIRTVVVTDDRGTFWGVISVLDLLPFVDRDLSKTRAEDLMHPCEFVVDPQLSIEEAVELMDKHAVEYLVISQEHNNGEKRPVGILTSYDIVRGMAGVESGRIVGPAKLATPK